MSIYLVQYKNNSDGNDDDDDDQSGKKMVISTLRFGEVYTLCVVSC